jgi:hypothetical protein
VSGGYVPSLSMSASVHVRPGTVIESAVYAAQDRATVSLEDGRTYRAEVTLFAHRTELVRLRDALIAVVDELDAERAALAESLRADESAA